MKLLLIDDQERLIFKGNVDIKNFHIRGHDPNDYDTSYGALCIPHNINYKMDLRADLVEEKGSHGVCNMYPERIKEAKVEIKVCQTTGKGTCIHEQEDFHRKACNDWVCYCE